MNGAASLDVWSVYTKPISGTVCCARVASGHAAAPPSSDMNVRRFIASPSMQDHAQSAFNSAIKTKKDVGRNGEAVRQMCTAEILSHPCPRWVIHVIPAIAACPVRPESGHSATARVYEYAH